MMAEMTSGAALRELQHAHASLKKARELLKHGVDGSVGFTRLWDAGWSSLRNAHRVMSTLPDEAINDDVMTRQLSLQRSATALLVRLRRLKRRESSSPDAGDDDADDNGDERGED
jgi:hypothetical protein